MNNELISRIAELLQITTQKANELYPVLVNESALHALINNLVVAVIGVDILIISGWDVIEFYDNEKLNAFIKWLFIILTISAFVLYVIRPYLTPNITFLNGLFNK